MVQRCTNPKRSCYERYGGKGVRVCERWLRSVADFVADVGPRPSPKHTVDRIDNDGNYEPGNVRWATVWEQNNNRCSNKRVELNGRTMTIAEWAREIGVSPFTLSARLNRSKLSPNEALSAGTIVRDRRGERNNRAKLSDSDVRQIRALYGAGGVLQHELAARFGVTQSTIGSIVTGETWKHIANTEARP
jgi:DNA-binding XRE family transcriptional regulator